jgi:hypothetical protein
MIVSFPSPGSAGGDVAPRPSAFHGCLDVQIQSIAAIIGGGPGFFNENL